MSRTRTVRGATLVVAAAFALGACSDHPGTAAVVGSDSISQSRLDDVATALCAAQGGAGQSGSGQDLSSRAARQGALDVMINSSLSKQYADSLGVEADQEQVSAAVTANKATIDALPSRERSAFTTTLTDYAEGQLALIEVGQQALRKAGTANPTQQQALTEATRLRAEWAAKNADVSVDPRYGSYRKGALAAGSGSLSVPVSSGAKAGAKATPAPTWVSALPANQKCS